MIQTLIKMMNEDIKDKEERLEIFIPNGPRLGNEVIESIDVAKGFLALAFRFFFLL